MYNTKIDKMIIDNVVNNIITSTVLNKSRMFEVINWWE